MRRVVGADHPLVGMVLSNLGQLYHQYDRQAEADQCYRQSLLLRSEALGPEHPSLQKLLHHYAELLRQTGREEEAAELQARADKMTVCSAPAPEAGNPAEDNDARQLLDGLLPPTPLERWAALIHSSTQAAARRDWQQVEQNCLAALEIMEREEISPLARALTLRPLATAYIFLERYAEAEPLVHQFLGIYERNQGEEHAEVTDLLYHFGKLFQTRCRYNEAEPLLRRCWTIREKARGPDDAGVIEVLDALMWQYDKQRRFAEAEELARRSLGCSAANFGVRTRRCGRLPLFPGRCLRGVRPRGGG